MTVSDRRQNRTESPLATKRGVGAMGWFLSGYATWNRLTRVQRRVLLSGDIPNAHPRVRAGLREAGCVDSDSDQLNRWGQWVAHTRDATLYLDLFAFDDDGELLWRKAAS